MIKKLLFSFFLIGIFFSILFITPGFTFAATTLPAGGESVNTATPLALGDYSNLTLPYGNSVFYLIDKEILPGQEIHVKVLFDGATNLGIYIYDQDYQILTKKEYIHDNVFIYWLNGSQKRQKYYLQIKNQAINETNLSLVSIEVADRYDANVKTDAGATPGEALPVEPGQYTGFLDFNYDAEDEKDYYQIDLSKGQNLTVKATPPKDLYLELSIYDEDGNEIVSDKSQNSGSVVTGSTKAEKNGKFYILVATGDYDSDQSGASQYNLSLISDSADTGKKATTNAVDSGDNNSQTKPASKNTVGLLILVLVIILVVIGVTAFLLTRNKSLVKQKIGKENEPEQDKKEAKEETIYCSACGTKNSPGNKFCSKCGHKLT